MLRRPQRTEAVQRLEARTARTFAAPLRGGVSKPIAPRAAGGSRLGLKREHGAYRCFRSRSTARALRSGTGRARGTGVVSFRQPPHCMPRPGAAAASCRRA